MMKPSPLFSLLYIFLGGILSVPTFSQEVCPVYDWPSELKNLKKFGQDMKQHLLG